MYDIRQFRPLLYALLLIGFTGYSLAAETPGLWVLAVGGTLINAYLVRRQAFKPIPRMTANIITLLFAAWMIIRVRSSPGGSPIFAIGEFLTYLQLVKLFEQRGNRDIAQLLVLSLLLMIAAAVSTGSLLFGILFVLYLFLSLYCCLLFHLKAESDYARQVTGLDDAKANPMTLLQDQRFLARSMRRLAFVVSGFSIATALAVFLLFPRSIGAGMIGSLAFQPSQAMTGFNDTIDFQDVAKITQNDAQVAWVKVTKNDRPWGSAGDLIYFRGNVCDTYVSDPADINHWRWMRSPDVAQAELPNRPPLDGQDIFQQQVTLLPTGTKTLFALPGVESFDSNQGIKPTRTVDDVLATSDDGMTNRTYTVVSNNSAATHQPDAAQQQSVRDQPGAPVRSYPVAQEIKTFAMRPDVAGLDASGKNLAELRAARSTVSPLDEQLAENFEAYLKGNFKYSLDLTDAGVIADKDPIVQFLYDFKRGHCEYFAGAMTLMCQSVGMKARVVVGFKCDEYNSMGGYYVVRQSHAHAWVEVLTLNGWQRFDPTSGSESVVGSRKTSVWQRVKAAFNFLEYKWGNAVVNYDSESQTNVISNAENQLTTTAINTTGWMQDVKNQLYNWFLHLTGNDENNPVGVDNGLQNLSNFYVVLTWLITGAIVVLAGAAIVIVLLRLRLYRRARRIGLQTLPTTDQRRLARQLAFYDQMLQTLERRKIVRADHLTPREFGASVGYLPAEAYHLVQRLTRVFYRVRYGEAVLQSAQQKRLMRGVERIEALLGAVDA